MEHQDWETIVLKKPPDQKKIQQQISKAGPKPTPGVNYDEEGVAPPKIPTNLKKAIQQGRLAKRMSQKDLANKLNVSLNDIVNYENGKAVPNNQFISRIEKVLNVKLPRVKKNKPKD